MATETKTVGDMIESLSKLNTPEEADAFLRQDLKERHDFTEDERTFDEVLHDGIENLKVGLVMGAMIGKFSKETVDKVLGLLPKSDDKTIDAVPANHYVN